MMGVDIAQLGVISGYLRGTASQACQGRGLTVLQWSPLSGTKVSNDKLFLYWNDASVRVLTTCPVPESHVSDRADG